MGLYSTLAGVTVHHHVRHAGLLQRVSGYEANSKVLQTASDLLGTLNNIRVS